MCCEYKDAVGPESDLPGRMSRNNVAMEVHKLLLQLYPIPISNKRFFLGLWRLLRTSCDEFVWLLLYNRDMFANIAFIDVFNSANLWLTCRKKSSQLLFFFFCPQLSLMKNQEPLHLYLDDLLSGLYFREVKTF